MRRWSDDVEDGGIGGRHKNPTVNRGERGSRWDFVFYDAADMRRDRILDHPDFMTVSGVV